jgi:hypothetical protein
MRMSRPLAAAAFLAFSASMVFFSCDILNPKDKDNTPGSVSQGAVLEETIGYTATANEITMTEPAGSNCWSYCDGTELVEECDTSSGSDESIPYTLSGNTLSFGVDQSEMESGAVVQLNMVLTRVGDGTGLQGVWKVTGMSYTVLSGTLTPAEKAELDEAVASDDFFDEMGSMELQITATQINVYYLEGGYSWADDFIDEWNGEWSSDPSYADSANYNVTVTKVNNNTIKLVGKKNGETVTITWDNSAETITYTSTDAAHSAHTYYENPTSCPNNYYPSWYYEFLSANSKGLMKAGGREGELPRRKGFRGLFR